MKLLCRDSAEITVAAVDFFDRLRARLAAGARLVTFYGRPDDDPSIVTLTAVFETTNGHEAMRCALPRGGGFRSLTPEHPAAHVFEREIFEETGLEPRGHPWLKPVRFSGARQGKMAEYPFYRVDGKEVHEVGVGPIHAGVIEPGHFRFMCLGEIVHHLEIQLGYQHRGAQDLLMRRSPWALTPLVETLAGDTSIAHAWAFCAALEALGSVEVDQTALVSRGIALELERVAMHLAGLAGMATDIAFLQGGSTYGRLRTTAINSTMLLCGSRFGRGWLRPGGARAVMTAEQSADLRHNLALIRRDVAVVDDLFLSSRTVRHRLRGVGALDRDQAKSMGLVGMAARACGIAMDARVDVDTGAPYAARKPAVVVEDSGDCWARALVRIREIGTSLAWLDAALDEVATLDRRSKASAWLKPGALAVGVCEGWRGEVVHCIETDENGVVKHVHVQDPSLRNWFGVALAVRDNEISDFPICNKSFDLSYCGNDL